MDSSLRNQAMVSLQNQQQQRQRNGGIGGSVGVSAGSGLGASLVAHSRQNYQTSHHHYQQQHQQYGSIPQHQEQKQQQHYYGQPQGKLSSSIHQQRQHYYSNDHMSVGSHYSRQSHASSHNSSTVDEAYRRAGQRLSMRAHGGDLHSLNRPRLVARLGVTAQSGFSSYSDVIKERENPSVARTTADISDTEDRGALAGRGRGQLSPSLSSSNMNRTSKVARKRLSDHGDHHSHGLDTVDGQLKERTPMQKRNGNLVRKMTINANEMFRIWQREHAKERKNHKRASPNISTSASAAAAAESITSGDLSPHRRAFSQMALEASGVPQNTQQQQLQNNARNEQHRHDRLSTSSIGSTDLTFGTVNSSILNSNHGLLSSVIETASQTSSKVNSKNGNGFGGEDTGSVRSKESRGSSSIATRSSVGTRNSMHSTVPPQGKCLTQPSEGVSNEGLDNADGNLIVHENDSISITQKQIHTLTKEKMKNVHRADFRVKSILGQGTFAQVFQCLHVQTGQTVAVKVVKNKPAYTRQAAVEIDVFRALTKPPLTDHSGKADYIGDHDTKWEYMVDMVCYFMYQGHLCLVFELLGLNLYEVLKKRQFRGLPLMVVRTLVHQAVLGTKELAQKSIVHCDLKPENVLLVTEFDVDSVVTAGENKRLSSSFRSTGSLDKKQASKELTVTVVTSGPNSGNSTSTSQTENTKKKNIGKEGSEYLEGTPSTTATISIHKTPPTSIPSNKHVMDWKHETLGKEVLSSSPTHSDGTHTTGTQGYSLAEQRIKLIDFGSACFEGQTSHTYIQSRFYRSPEVLIGLTYDSAIDMWSLGCVAAELFLGLPILPGVHEHDQLFRIYEMIGELPDWMLDQGSKSQKYFVKYVPVPTPPIDKDQRSSPPSRQLPQWRMKTQAEYISSLSPSEIKRKGGLAKLEKQPANRYFKRRLLADIILHKGQSCGVQEEKEQLLLFIHFLYGILDPDPWKRWTAFQAASHPFLTGNISEGRFVDSIVGTGADENHANKKCHYYWQAPSDPTIYRRKLLNVQKMRERQQAARQRLNRHGNSRTQSPLSQTVVHENGSTSGPYADESLGGIMRGQQIRPGSHQLSSSLTDSVHHQAAGMPLVGDSASVVSSHRPFLSGPQSYCEAGPSGSFQGSFSELDFAYALQRPGVVPMGDASVCSSVDLNGTSQFGSYSHQQQFTSYPMVGSYGSHRVSRNPQKNWLSNANVQMSSRSFDEGGTVIPTTIQDSPLQAHHALVSSSHGSVVSMGPPANVPAGSVPQNISSSTTVPTPTGLPAMVQQQQQHHHHPPMDGNLAAQVYLQQQHAALKQQQLFLQQQQAALALQQQQLQAYGMNPVMLSANGFNGAMNPEQPYGFIGNPGQAAAPGMGGGYYYVFAADGTPMLVAANQGMVGQTMPGPMMTSQVQGPMASMPGSNTGGMMGQQIPNMVGIPGVMPFSPTGIPGMIQAPTGMMSSMPPSNNNAVTNPTAPFAPPGVMYPNNNLYQQPHPSQHP